MIGGIASFATSNPLSVPSTRPIASAMAKAAASGNPPPCASNPVTMALRPSTGATDRSIPRVAMTSV